MKATTFALTLLLSLLGGCSLLPPSASQPLAIDHTPLPPPEYLPGELNRETLYELIVAEMAGQHQQYQLSLDNYLHQSRLTKDPAIAQRATYIAQYLQQPDRVLEAASLWQQAEPDNPEPYQIAASLLLRKGDFSTALPLLEKALDHSDPQALLVIGAQAEQLSADELEAYSNLLHKHNDNTNTTLLTTLGILYRHQGRLDKSLHSFNRAIALNSDNHEAVIQKAELLRSQEKYPQALAMVKKQLPADKPNQQLYTIYIQLLFQNNQAKAATREAKNLLMLYPDEPQLGFYIALLLLENKKVSDSRQILEQLLQQFPSNTAPHYYLGLIAQQQQNRDKAIHHFLQVRDSNNIIQSFARISALLDHADNRQQLQSIMQDARNSQPQINVQLYTLEAEWLNLHNYKTDALNLLDEALKQHQDNITLLYTRAMLLDPQDISLMEQDLRKVIALEPNNSMALNALGYSLAIYTDRFDEALQLISEALEITPDDPAVLDSMGWILFKLERFEEAIDYLERAYNAFPDPEVSSHLIQAYHAVGQSDRASRLLLENQLKNPDNEHLKEAAKALSKTAAEPSE